MESCPGLLVLLIFKGGPYIRVFSAGTLSFAYFQANSFADMYEINAMTLSFAYFQDVDASILYPHRVHS